MSIFNMYPQAPDIELNILGTLKYSLTTTFTNTSSPQPPSAAFHMLRWRDLSFVSLFPYVQTLNNLLPLPTRWSTGFIGIAFCSTTSFSWLLFFHSLVYAQVTKVSDIGRRLSSCPVQQNLCSDRNASQLHYPVRLPPATGGYWASEMWLGWLLEKAVRQT